MADVKEARWCDIWPECEPLMRAHWVEVRRRQLLPFKIDWKSAEIMDSAGIMPIMAVWQDTRLIGYSIWYISPSLESMGNQVALQGPWYIKPEYRNSKLGLQLWNKSLEQLRQRNITVIYPHHWEDGAGDRLGDFFIRLGAEKLETIYELKIGA